MPAHWQRILDKMTPEERAVNTLGRTAFDASGLPGSWADLSGEDHARWINVALTVADVVTTAHTKREAVALIAYHQGRLEALALKRKIERRPPEPVEEPEAVE